MLSKILLVINLRNVTNGLWRCFISSTTFKWFWIYIPLINTFKMQSINGMHIEWIACYCVVTKFNFFFWGSHQYFLGSLHGGKKVRVTLWVTGQRCQVWVPPSSTSISSLCCLLPREMRMGRFVYFLVGSKINTRPLNSKLVSRECSWVISGSSRGMQHPPGVSLYHC